MIMIEGVVVIVVALMVVSVALLGSDVVNCSGADVGSNQLIGTDPECFFVISIVLFRQILILQFLRFKWPPFGVAILAPLAASVCTPY